ncbi:MAG: hypothetical protein KAI64_07710, partial [Thermoplasmata archaeon]|nr:hypothetical protein [Thermoplasmata archaeon]
IKDYRPNISAIVVTDYMKEMSNQVKDALEKGAFTCFEKPLVMEQLLSLLEQIRGQKAGSAPKKPG